MKQPIFILLFLSLHLARATTCDRDNGPAGVTECIQISRYNNEYQWATCLTNAYIQQKSSHQHQCTDRTRTYCWYQCMLEVYEKDSGPVSDDCSCQLSNTTAKPYAGVPTTSLPQECESPKGDSCDWYRNCLEKRYPCEDTSNAYAIKYAEKFCRLYENRSSLFSPEGRKWVDAVRKCLQVSLVPILRPWYKFSCEDIRQWAFDSHTPCYLDPDEGAPSICDLDCLDFFKIFWTIKGSFIQLDTFWETLKGMWNIGARCGVASQIAKCFKPVKEAYLRVQKAVIKIIKIVIKKLKKLLTWGKRSTSDPLPEADAQSRFADRVGSAIATAMNWNADVMDWLAYPENTTAPADDPDIMNIIIVLADIKALGIVNTSAPAINFNQTIKEFALTVANGTLPLQVDGTNVWVKSLASCSDKSCNSSQVLAVSDKPPTITTTTTTIFKWSTRNSARIAYSNFRLYGFTATLVLFVDKLFF